MGGGTQIRLALVFLDWRPKRLVELVPRILTKIVSASGGKTHLSPISKRAFRAANADVKMVMMESEPSATFIGHFVSEFQVVTGIARNPTLIAHLSDCRGNQKACFAIDSDNSKVWIVVHFG